MLPRAKRRILAGALSVPMLGLGLSFPTDAVLAQAPAAAPTSAAPTNQPSTNAMVNLIRLLVKQGTITQANGDALLAQAEADAQQARSTIVQAAANAGVPPPPEGTVRVPYVPENVRRQITEQVRTEVMAQAKSERWAAPEEAAPEWTRHIKVSGDIRVRSASELYARNNTNQVLNVAAINATTSGFNFTADGGNLPFLNSTQDRANRLRLRGRLAIDADVAPGVEAGFRIATGNDNGPISTDQNLGGGLTKRNLWLDRAFVRVRPTDWWMVEGGRMPNPFWSTPLLFDIDVNFDGVAGEVKADKWLPDGFSLALRGGAFPLDFGSANYPDTRQTKAGYPSKWLFSGQIEGSYKTDSGLVFSAAVGFHDFHNVRGRLSSPCVFNGVNVRLVSGDGLPLNDPSQCSTDGSAAFGATKGNTYFFIRNLAVPQNETNPIPLNQRQYLGLTYKYQVLDFNASVKAPVNDDVSAVLSGEYLRNLAFSHRDDCRYGITPITNLAPNGSGDACLASNPNPMKSGNIGWLVNLAVGYPHPAAWGEWRLEGSYRYLQSDATLDSLVDSDFHLGGTNTKGYTIGGSFGIMKNTTIGARWLSANQITGAPLAIDVLQFDFLTEF